MRERLQRLLFGTLRRQLIIAVACVHAVMMALFVWDLTVRQEDMLLARQTEQAIALAQSVAVSSAGWLAARDVAGLQEIVAAQQRYPELRFAMVIDKNGQILAHSERSRMGQFVRDLPASAEVRLMAKGATLVDVAAPVKLAAHHVGWVRIGISQGSAGAALVQITRNGILYALAAIAVGVLLAWALARRLTARLDAIQVAVDAVKAGDSARRAEVTGSDEASRLAHEFNVMLDALGEREAELNLHRTHLEQLVEQRTSALETARDTADAANRAKSIFLANMSHELRTPLNAILGFTQLLMRDQQLQARQRDQLGTVYKSGRHLLALINDVLEISRIESGRLAVNPESFDLPGLLGSLAESMAVRAGEKGLKLNLETHDDLPTHVRADISKLRQVLLNLLSNAVKYTEQGEVVLRASAVVQGEQVVLNFAVSDTGVGIAADEVERLGQVFYQTQQGVQRGEGTGLGLAISREYIKLLGGTLEVQSSPGRGSVFSFSIPAAIAAATEAAAGAMSGIVGLVPGQPECRVLVAEADGVSRELLRSMLQRAGFAVKTVEDGEQAVAHFTAWQPHFVWMDMSLPRLDGYAATRRLRALAAGDKSQQERVPIVALTASAFEENGAAILAAGCDDVTHKPLDMGRLLEIMARCLPEWKFSSEEVEAVVDAGTALQTALGECSKLAPALRQRLEHAAVNLDNAAARALAAEISATQPRLAEAIQVLCDNYQLGRLADGSCPGGAAITGTADAP